MANVVDILIKAKDETSGAFKSAEKNMKGLDDAAETSKSKSMSFADSWSMALLGINQAIGIARVAVDGFKQALEFSKEGAALERLEKASGMMAESVGQDMDEIVSAVSDASQGMVSDSDIMQAATRALMLGVGQSAEDMAGLMEVAAIRGQAMGISTQQAFNDIVTGIGRESRMILDNLGIVLDLEQVYKDYADQLGVTAEQLTNVEKKQAMVNAVIQDTQPLLEQAGDDLRDSYGEWEALKASQKNYFDSVKKNTVTFGETWAMVWNELFTQGKGRLEIDPLIDQLLELGVAAKDIEDVLGAVYVNGEMYYDAAAGVENLTEEYGYLFDEIESNQLYDGSFSDAAIVAADSTQLFADATVNATEAEREFSGLDRGYYEDMEAIERATQATLEYTEAFEQAISVSKNISGIISLAEEYDDILEEITEQEQIMADNPIGSEKWTEAKTKVDELKQSMTELANQMVLDMYQATLAIGGFTDAEMEAYFNMATELGVISEEAANFAMESYYNAKAEIEGNPINAVVTISTPNLDSTLASLKALAQSRTATIYTNVLTTNTPLREAAGGVVHAASGMAMQAPYLVGEVGPEPFFPAVDGRILSNSQAMSALRSGGRSASVVNVTINTPVNFADRVWVENELAPYIRSEIEKVSL